MPSKMPGILLATACFVLAALLMLPTAAPVRAETLQQKFSAADPASTAAIDHSIWQKLLESFVVAGEDGLNRVDYARFKREGASQLKGYLNELQKVDISAVNKSEQFAYWANLYNAKTIDIVLDHYPVESIRDIRLSGFLFPGPWREKVVTVAGTRLSLNDIEHEILRGIWRDPRVHYAVNCASVGCPNLPRKPFTGAALEGMLDAGARAYVNSPRGLAFTGGGITVSKIYDWFKGDFGGTEMAVLGHIRRYADPPLQKRLRNLTTIGGYAYDWSLNDTRR